MVAIVLFLLVLGAVVIVGWMVSKRTGSYVWPFDGWHYEEDETIVWRDDPADVAVIPTLGQALVMRPARLPRRSSRPRGG